MRISDWSSDVCSSDLSELLPYSLVQFRDIFLPEIIEADQIIPLRHVPEGPAVAAGRALGGSADLVDRALLAVERDRGVGADFRLPTALGVGKDRARFDHACFEQRAEGDAGLVLFRRNGPHRTFVKF